MIGGGPDADERVLIASVSVMEDNRTDLIGKLFRLGEEVRGVARQLSIDADDPHGSLDERSAFSFGIRTEREAGTLHSGSPSPRRLRPPLPDPRLVRGIIRQRELRTRFFDASLFADPAWDMLLDLAAARAEHQRVSVTSLCIASGVPLTTALRWIGQMVDAGLLERTACDVDRRRAFISLTSKAADAMARYFAVVQAKTIFA